MKMEKNVNVALKMVNLSNSARRRSKDFNLTYEYIYNLMNQTSCAYSGEPFGNTDDESLTFERWNNSKGYVIGNVIAVKRKYNSLRSNFELNELIALRDSLSGKITRSADVKVESYRLFRNANLAQWIEFKKSCKTRANVSRNLKQRKVHLAQIEKQGNASAINQISIKNLRVRIYGGSAELGRLNQKIQSFLNKGAKTPKKLSEATNKAESYDIIIKGLTRFESMGFLDKIRVKKGLPLDAGIVKIIKGKM